MDEKIVRDFHVKVKGRKREGLCFGKYGRGGCHGGDVISESKDLQKV